MKKSLFYVFTGKEKKAPLLSVDRYLQVQVSLLVVKCASTHGQLQRSTFERERVQSDCRVFGDLIFSFRRPKLVEATSLVSALLNALQQLKSLFSFCDTSFSDVSSFHSPLRCSCNRQRHASQRIFLKTSAALLVQKYLHTRFMICD